MEETQALDFQLASFPESLLDVDDVEVGSLDVVYPDGRHERHPLLIGQNVVARRSAQRQRDEEKLQTWKGENLGVAVHGIFVESASVSSPHATLYVEGRGSFCFVKDKGSKNKTLLEAASGSVVLQPGDRYSVLSGAAIKFGNIGCTITFAAQPAEGVGGAAAPQQAPPLRQEETQVRNAVKAAVVEAAPHASQSQPQPDQAAVAAPAPAQVRTLPPHLHAAKRPPAAPPARPPAPRPRPPPVVIPPPNAWPTAPLPLPSQLKPEQPQKSTPPAQRAQAEQPKTSEAAHASAWASFQKSATISMQKAHSIGASSAALQTPAPADKTPSNRRSLDSLSPFASASAEGPAWGEPGDSPGASSAVPIPLPVRGSMDREGSMKNVSSISSLRDWGAAKGVSRRCSTERLPSLQDWMLPLCISSPVASSGPKADTMSRACSQDLLCSEAMPRADQFVQWACNAGGGAARPGLPAVQPLRASHDVLERMPNMFPELAPVAPARSNSASPKRGRGDSSDDSPTAAAAAQQRPKSPRLTRSALSSSFTLGAALGPPAGRARAESPRPPAHDAGFADCHRAMDSLWGSGGEGPRHKPLPEATTAR